VQQIVQPAYNAVPYASPTINQVGLPLRMQAAAAYTMQSDPEWQQYQQFRAMLQMQQAAQQWTQQQQAATAPATGNPPDAPQTPPEPLPPATGPATVPNVATPSTTPWAADIPTIVAHCAKCHSGPNAEGEFWADGSADLRAPAAVENRDRIMHALINQRMPKGHRLTGEEAGAIVAELYAE
jgi:hypothetical protein